MSGRGKKREREERGKGDSRDKRQAAEHTRSQQTDTQTHKADDDGMGHGKLTAGKTEGSRALHTHSLTHTSRDGEGEHE